ncbi:MAG TPA: glycine cleavage system protein GcvH [Firmicutes bacterium]|nr:glycine cleavage system protein GcvH [Bacillota bacterium]
MNYPEDLRYSKKHEWIRIDGRRATVGITQYAQDQLGAVVGIDLPEIGKAVERDEELADIDSMKTADVIYAPVSGTVVEVNSTLEEHPEYINDDPYGEGWICVLEVADPGEVDSLMTAGEYEAFVRGLRAE